MELEKGVLWVWDAATDYHATTVNRLQLKKPKKWGMYAREDPDAAQWTVVSVLPKAVTRAARSEEEKMKLT